MPSWFSSHSIIRFDLGIIRRPDHCSDCLLSYMWPSAKHYLEETNRLHWSSISVMYFQRFWRWIIFNQLRANVACFLANNAWYPYVWASQALEQRTRIEHTALCDGSKEGSPAVPPQSNLFTYPKQNHDPIRHMYYYNSPFWHVWSFIFLKKSESRAPLGRLSTLKQMLVYWWFNFCNAGPTLIRHNLNVFRLLGYDTDPVLLFMLSNTRYILFSWFVYDFWWMSKIYKHEYKHDK